MLLGFVVVSGVLSEQSMRGVRLVAAPAEEIYAGRPARFSVTVVNGKRWGSSYSIRVEVLTDDPARPSLYVAHVPAGGEQMLTWEATLPDRGRHHLPPLRLTTRFPFGLFWKAARPVAAGEVLVFPAIVPVSPEGYRPTGGDGDQPARRRGAGHDLYNLREYLMGDAPRLIHWRSSAKASSLIVRDLEAPTQLDTRIVLIGTGVRNPERLEQGL